MRKLIYYSLDIRKIHECGSTVSISHRSSHTRGASAFWHYRAGLPTPSGGGVMTVYKCENQLIYHSSLHIRETFFLECGSTVFISHHSRGASAFWYYRAGLPTTFWRCRGRQVRHKSAYRPLAYHRVRSGE